MIREDIIRAAARVFGKVGYEKATLEDVAKIVGIRKASLYHHIRSKEELLLALHDQMADEAMARTLLAMNGLTEPKDQIRAICHALMRLIADHRDASVVFLHEYAIPRSARWSEITAKRDRYEQLVRGILAQGMKDGSFRRADLHVATLGVLGMLNWAHRWFRPGGRMTADAIADVFADLMLKGLEASGRRRAAPVRRRRATTYR